MKSFLNSCNSSKSANPAEVKAVLFAAGACVLFIGFLSAFHRSEQRHNQTTVVTGYEAPYEAPPPMPVPPVTIKEPPLDMNARFRVVPANFRGTDFMNYNYGTYEFSNGTKRDLVLVNGKARHFENSNDQLFDLDDVLYTDLTGDGSPEAIVLLTHVEWGQQSNGGKSLLYVYSQNYAMQEILKYESGNGKDGCSLKSINVKNRELTLDLFDRCPKPTADPADYVPRKNTLYVTRVEYVFNGTWLVPKKRSYVSVPDRHEVSHGVEINIVDKHVPAQQDF